MNFQPTKLKRVIFFVLCDILIFAASIFIAFLLRFSGDIPDIFYHGMFLGGICLVTIKTILMWTFKIYRVPWKFFGLYEARKIFFVHVLAAIIFMIVFFFFYDFFNPFPRSVVIIDAIVSFLLVGALRISKRMIIDSSKPSKTNTPCIVVGATSKTIHILNGIKQGYLNYYAIGVVDGRAEMIGTYCNGFLVQPKSAIKKLVEENEATTAIIALALRPEELKELFDELTGYGIKDVKIFSLIEKEKPQIKDISIEDLLARKPKDLDSKVVENFIKNKVVLVTGAGGTIGSEICKQCLKFGAKQLIMVDHSEYNLYQIDQDVSQDKRNVLKMINITDKKELEKVFSEFKPEIIFHAAAYKHVPMCELNPHEAVINNILGTKNLVDLSKLYGAKRLVMISTDKAVRPTSIMGATKRVCELYTLNSNEAQKTEIVSVRFGNVLGSSGSVIPKFKAQIAANKPLTVTHPDIVRYFMLVSEACQLVLQASAIAKGGELFVLDMGKPVKIANLANRMLLLAGREDLGVEFVGLRPGEKLYEELMINPNDVSTKYESIFVTGLSNNYDINVLNEQIKELIDLPNEQVATGLKKIVPEFNHKLNEKENA